MYANPGARDRTFNLRILIRGAQLTTLWLRKNTFSGVHESGRGLFLRWSSEVRKKTCSNAVKKNLRGISSELDLGQHLAFMKVFSSGICSELQKTFRSRNSSRNSASFLKCDSLKNHKMAPWAILWFFEELHLRKLSVLMNL